MPKKAKNENGKEKSAQELETAYITKVEHAMERVAMWSGKLSKLVRSKKTYLTDSDKAKLSDDYAEVADATLQAMKDRGTTSTSGYQLR